ncbi:MAG: SDR family oxidoreductase [Chloroflexi bacterium]|nr:MAG: SDR family oxidoreductase [Chloroflexota bacterium]
MTQNGQRFKDKVVIVTGAAKGIGRAIALRFGSEGAHIIVNDVDTVSAEATTQSIIANGGSALAGIADVSDKSQVDRLFDTTLERFGTVDVLVNNASLTNTARHFLEADETWWDKILAVNLKAAFLSLDLAPYGIRVNALVPGSIDSKGMSAETKQERGEGIPLGRVGETEEVAGPAAFLASDDASYITGHMLVVDGGLLSQQRSPQVDTFLLSRFPKLESE